MNGNAVASRFVTADTGPHGRHFCRGLVWGVCSGRHFVGGRLRGNPVSSCDWFNVLRFFFFRIPTSSVVAEPS